MRKNYRNLNVRIILTVGMFACAQLIYAYDFIKDGIYYNILKGAGNFVEVTHKGDGTSSKNASNSYSGKIIIPEKVDFDGIEYQVESIGDYAFFKCTGVTEVILPYSISYIGRYAFAECRNMKEMYLPDGVTNLEHSAFSGCSKWTRVLWPHCLQIIGDEAFAQCSGLTSIEIPVNVRKIGKGAFSNNSSLQKLVIGKNVEFIDDNAFLHCPNITWVTVMTMEPPKCSSIAPFDKAVFKNATLFIPEEYKEQYQDVNVWKQFAEVGTLVLEDSLDDPFGGSVLYREELKNVFNSLSFMLFPYSGQVVNALTSNLVQGNDSLQAVVIRRYMKEQSLDDMVDYMMIPIFKDSVCLGELQAITTLMDSPEGKRFLNQRQANGQIDYLSQDNIDFWRRIIRMKEVKHLMDVLKNADSNKFEEYERKWQKACIEWMFKQPEFCDFLLKASANNQKEGKRKIVLEENKLILPIENEDEEFDEYESNLMLDMVKHKMLEDDDLPKEMVVLMTLVANSKRDFILRLEKPNGETVDCLIDNQELKRLLGDKKIDMDLFNDK